MVFTYICKKHFMATNVKPVPTLRGNAAIRFIESAEINANSRRESVDFSKQAQKAVSILKRSKLNKL